MIGRMTRAFGADDVARLPAKSTKRRLLMIADRQVIGAIGYVANYMSARH
jgi:hypothetical protein